MLGLISLLERTIKGLRADLAAARKAREAADDEAAKTREELAAMRAWTAARRYDGQPYRGLSLEEFRQRQDEERQKPRWQREAAFFQPRMTESGE